MYRYRDWIDKEPHSACLAARQSAQLRHERITGCSWNQIHRRGRDAQKLHTSLERLLQTMWKAPYETMAREDQLPWATLDEVAKAVQAFLDPVLAGGLEAIWDPVEWAWRVGQ